MAKATSHSLSGSTPLPSTYGHIRPRLLNLIFESRIPSPPENERKCEYPRQVRNERDTLHETNEAAEHVLIRSELRLSDFLQNDCCDDDKTCCERPFRKRPPFQILSEAQIKNKTTHGHK